MIKIEDIPIRQYLGLENGAEFVKPIAKGGLFNKCDRPNSIREGISTLTIPFSREPLLTIEVSDIGSVPVIKYKGKEINNIIHVNYEWKTRTEYDGIHRFNIRYAEQDESGYPVEREIEIDRK